MCLYPSFIINRRYIPNKKNGGQPPPLKDNRMLYVPVGCGKCQECLKQKQREWAVRLEEEIRTDKSGKFVTLTLSNQSFRELGKDVPNFATGYIRDNEIATLAIRRFLERWRWKYKVSVKHWFVTEWGQNATERMHLHGIIWTDEVDDIGKIWKYGNVFIGDYVNERSINYIVKYLGKYDEKHKNYVGKILTSPGIGKYYTERMDALKNKYIKNETNETYRTRSGNKLQLPIYYRNKIYTEEEREKLWIEKLDKQEIWVMGEKIDVSTEQGQKDYEEALKYQQKKNNRLGYGNNSVDWEKKRYLWIKRKIKHETDWKNEQERRNKME